MNECHTKLFRTSSCAMHSHGDTQQAELLFEPPCHNSCLNSSQLLGTPPDARQGNARSGPVGVQQPCNPQACGDVLHPLSDARSTCLHAGRSLFPDMLGMEVAHDVATLDHGGSTQHNPAVTTPEGINTPPGGNLACNILSRPRQASGTQAHLLACHSAPEPASPSFSDLQYSSWSNVSDSIAYAPEWNVSDWSDAVPSSRNSLDSAQSVPPDMRHRVPPQSAGKSSYFKMPAPPAGLPPSLRHSMEAARGAFQSLARSRSVAATPSNMASSVESPPAVVSSSPLSGPSPLSRLSVCNNHATYSSYTLQPGPLPTVTTDEIRWQHADLPVVDLTWPLVATPNTLFVCVHVRPQTPTQQPDTALSTTACLPSRSQPAAVLQAVATGKQIFCQTIDRLPQDSMIPLPSLAALQTVTIFSTSGTAGTPGPAHNLLVVTDSMSRELHEYYLAAVQHELLNCKHAMASNHMLQLQDSLSIGSTLAKPCHVPWTLDTAAAAACHQAYHKDFHSILNDLCYLVTCSPCEFATASPGPGLADWDKRVYLSTLARLVANLERRALWATASGLLHYCSQQGVYMLQRGERVLGDSLAPDALRSLLAVSAHGEIRFKFVPEAFSRQLLPLLHLPSPTRQLLRQSLLRSHSASDWPAGGDTANGLATSHNTLPAATPSQRSGRRLSAHWPFSAPTVAEHVQPAAAGMTPTSATCRPSLLSRSASDVSRLASSVHSLPTSADVEGLAAASASSPGFAASCIEDPLDSAADLLAALMAANRSATSDRGSPTVSQNPAATLSAPVDSLLCAHQEPQCRSHKQSDWQQSLSAQRQINAAQSPQDQGAAAVPLDLIAMVIAVAAWLLMCIL